MFFYREDVIGVKNTGKAQQFLLHLMIQATLARAVRYIPLAMGGDLDYNILVMTTDKRFSRQGARQ